MRRGNPNLKRAHETIEVTYEQIEELKRCMVDPVYFIRNYVYITTPMHGMIKFELYDYQEELIRAYQENRYNIVLSARQTGKTETSCAYMLWYAIFHDRKTVLVVSKDSEAAMEIIKKIQDAYEELPHWLKPGIQDDDWNKHTAGFDNNSRIIAKTTTPTSGRGLAISLLYCDELGFVQGHVQDSFWNSIYPTLSCVSGDTLVLTNNGFSRIEELFKDSDETGKLYTSLDNISLYSHLGMKKISHKYISPKSETKTILTETGRELTVTPHHPLTILTNKGEDLVQADYLTLNDYLRVDINTQQFGNKNISLDEAYMIGGYIAEGWITQNSVIWISNADDEFKQSYLNNFFVNDKNFNHKIRLCSREKIRKWKNIGINPELKCYNKIIPSEILKMNKEVICNFLAGMFDGDGSITDKAINYTTTSKQLAQELQILLNNLGIICRIYKNGFEKRFEKDKNRILPQGTKLKSLRDAWYLHIPLTQCKKFRDNIPLKIQKKKNKLDKIIENKQQDDFKHFYVPVIPEIKYKLNEIILETKKTKAWYRKNGIRFDKCLDKNNNRKITKRKLKKWLKVINDFDLPISISNKKLLEELSNDNIYWEKIKNIKNTYREKTYDFTVPIASTFAQNGIMGSNTGGSCIITSTPNGDTNLFAKLWRGAESGANDFYPNRIYWDQPPGRDEKFKEETIKQLGSERRWLQEYECLAGNNYIYIKDENNFVHYLTIEELYKSLEYGEICYL